MSLRVSPSILAIYERSYFQVKGKGGRLVRFTSRTLPKKPALSAKVFAVLTAWNPMGCELSLSENRERHRKLHAILKKSGYSFYRTTGWLKGHAEVGFTIENIPITKAVKVGKMFKQYALFYNDARGPRFVRCSSGVFRGRKPAKVF